MTSSLEEAMFGGPPHPGETQAFNLGSCESASVASWTIRHNTAEWQRHSRLVANPEPREAQNAATRTTQTSHDVARQESEQMLVDGMMKLSGICSNSLRHPRALQRFSGSVFPPQALAN